MLKYFQNISDHTLCNSEAIHIFVTNHV